MLGREADRSKEKAVSKDPGARRPVPGWYHPVPCRSSASPSVSCTRLCKQLLRLPNAGLPPALGAAGQGGQRRPRIKWEMPGVVCCLCKMGKRCVCVQASVHRCVGESGGQGTSGKVVKVDTFNALPCPRNGPSGHAREFLEYQE